MYQIGQNFTLRITLSFTICASLLLLPGVSLLSEASHGQGQTSDRAVKPRHKKPEGILPDLEDIKRESQVERTPPAPIHSTQRSPKLSEKPWNGRRVGDPETTQRQLDQAVVIDKKIRRAHARRRMSPPPPMYEDQFIQNFFNIALLRGATYDEALFWNYQLRSAYSQGQTSLKLAAVELGKTVFESASYAARMREPHGYVYDLYKTYLMREPDAGGWAYWESQVGPNGRENVRRAFEECGEFATLLGTIVLSGAATNPASLITARVEPRNQPGNGMLARDVNWSVSLLSLPGRNGLDLGLALSYSSMVWTPSGPYFHFDEDNGFPSPGFRLGFPTVQRKVFDAQTAKNAYLLITPAGRRVELRQVGTSNVYEAGDSSYLQLIDYSPSPTLLLRSTDGTQLSFVEINNEFSCTQIKDRNGNYISVFHNALGRITSITDTLGRVITFNYDSYANLISITQAWNGQPAHQWVSFGWSTRNMQYSFPTEKVIGVAAGAPLPVITQVALNNTSYFNFEYTNSLQVSAIRNYFGGVERNATTFGYETPSGDVARLASSSVSAQNWTGVNGMPAQVTTLYGVDGGACVMTAPDGTIYKEYYGTGWQKGLTTLSEIWSGGVRQKWTTTAWTQDNTTVGYETNPRVTETNVYDASNNRRRTTMDYHPAFGLLSILTEYAADAVTVMRRTTFDYKNDSVYLDRRIIGLPFRHSIYDGGWNLMAKTEYGYDWDWYGDMFKDTPAPATQHDRTNYGPSFIVGRGNLSQMARFDVNDPNNANNTITELKWRVNSTGSVLMERDHLWHEKYFAYGDNFSDGINHYAFAYPTTLTDADGYSSTVQYNYDFGATTRTQSPAPAGQSQGAIQTMTYNSLGQLERVTTSNNSAYKRFWYGSNYVASYASVNNVADELYAIQVVDGVGRVIGATTNHPGSSGGYSLVSIIYDQMGRLWKQSNPTEINSSWLVSGDDAGGIYYTQQTYDWKGRPLVTTNTDSTTKTASYSGCGCAGGEVLTLTDEGTDIGTPGNPIIKKRQQKIYHDVLGRMTKREVMNWDGSGSYGTAPGNTVYSTTVSTYNARDQVQQILEYAGAEGSGTFQDTTFTYDGHGRLRTQHRPEQQVDPNNNQSTDHTTWDYNADDTIQKVTDARGATATYTYNGRHLTGSIVYTAPSPIPATPSVTYAYDAAANRISMSDAAGTATYSYDQLSRLTTETRQINALSNSSTGGSYPVTYEYNFADSVKKVTDPFGARIDYSRDTASRLIGVSGSAFAGVTQYVTNVQYRAWGGIKLASYTDDTATIQYNSRLLPTEYRLTYNGWVGTSENYSYFADGRISGLTDLKDTNGPSPPWTMRYLSRGWAYDHAGRVIDNSGPNGLPLRQSYAYDQFGNMTARWGTYFFQASQFQTATYVKNRRSDWGYDAQGNITNVPASATDPATTFTYDAAGQLVTRVQTTGSVTTTFSQGYDGDGELISAVTAPSGSSSTVGYDIHSSVLGTVLTELDQSGNKRKTHVSADGLLFASQNLNSGGAWVGATIRNPVGTGERTGAIYDPLGNYIPLQYYNDPRPPAGSYNSGSMSSLTANQANPDSYGVGCRMDGIPTSCNQVLQAINSGQAGTLVLYGATVNVALANMGLFLVEHPATPAQTRPPRLRFGKSRIPTPGNHDPYKGSREVDRRYWLVGLIDPQDIGRQIVPLGNLQKGLEDLLKKGDCGAFVQKLLDKANELFGGGHPHATSFWDAFGRIEDAGGYQFDDTVSNGGTVSGDLFWGELANPNLPEGPQAGPGTVRLFSFGTFGRPPRPREVALNQARYVWKAFHETLHLGKQGWYFDKELARAGHAVDGTTAPKYKEDDYLSWSGNLDEVLKRHCVYPSK